MSTSEIKEKLIGKIRQTDDEDLLNELYRILKIGTDDKFYKLNDEQLGLVQEAEEQIKRGEVISDEEADKEIDEWLNEK